MKYCEAGLVAPETNFSLIHGLLFDFSIRSLFPTPEEYLRQPSPSGYCHIPSRSYFQVSQSLVPLNPNFSFSCASKLLSSAISGLTHAQILALGKSRGYWLVLYSPVTPSPNFLCCIELLQNQGKGTERGEEAESLTWGALLQYGLGATYMANPGFYFHPPSFVGLLETSLQGTSPRNLFSSYMTVYPPVSLLGWPVSASGTGLVGPVSFQGSQSLAVIWGVLPAPWMTPISPTSGENAICFPFSSLYYPLLRLVSSASRFGFLQALCPPNPGEHLLNFPKHSLWSHNSLGFLQSASKLLWDRWARLRDILLLTSAFTSPPLPSYTYFE